MKLLLLLTHFAKINKTETEAQSSFTKAQSTEHAQSEFCRYERSTSHKIAPPTFSVLKRINKQRQIKQPRSIRR